MAAGAEFGGLPAKWCDKYCNCMQFLLRNLLYYIYVSPWTRDCMHLQWEGLPQLQERETVGEVIKMNHSSSNHSRGVVQTGFSRNQQTKGFWYKKTVFKLIQGLLSAPANGWDLSKGGLSPYGRVQPL